LIRVLASSISANSKAPALLKIMHAMTQSDKSIEIVAEREFLIVSIIECIAISHANVEVVGLVVEMIYSLLDYKNGMFMIPHITVCYFIIIHIYFLI
jgi:hypothetical protein